MRGYEALAAALVVEGTDVVFGLLGDGNMHALTTLVDRYGVRFVSARHEQAAVAMADGYSRVTGRPGVCSVTHGPGLTQTGTTLTAARLARSPVLLLAGDTPAAARLHGQNIDQQTLALATAGSFHPVRLPQTLAEDVRLAFRHVRLGLGPTVLDVRLDTQFAELSDEWSYVPSSAYTADPGRQSPDERQVATAVALLRGAQRPVVLAGRGALLAGAVGELLRLADRLEASVCTSLLAKGAFAGHPRDLGVAGGFATPGTRAALADADVVLAVGAGLNQFTTDWGRCWPSAQVVQVERDTTRVGWVTPVDCAVIGDARSACRALLDGLGEPTGPAHRPPREPVRAPDPSRSARPLADGADPFEVASVLEELLPRPRAVVVGVGHFSGPPAIAVSADDPLDFLLPWQLGSVGLALPVALGVATARPQLTTVAIEGDGGLLMSLPELETAARCGIPLLVVVLDDEAYGAELHLLARQGLPTELSRFRNPDLVAVARSLGLTAYDAPDADALRRVLDDLGPVTSPTLVRVRVSTQVVHEEIFTALSGVS